MADTSDVQVSVKAEATNNRKSALQKEYDARGYKPVCCGNSDFLLLLLLRPGGTSSFAPIAHLTKAADPQLGHGGSNYGFHALRTHSQEVKRSCPLRAGTLIKKISWAVEAIASWANKKFF